MRTSTHKFCAGVSNSERLFCCWYLGSKYYKYSTVPVGTLLLVSYLCSIPGTAFSSLRLRLVLGGVLDVVCVDRLAMSVAIGLVLERVGGRWVELRTAGGT